MSDSLCKMAQEDQWSYRLMYVTVKQEISTDRGYIQYPFCVCGWLHKFLVTNSSISQQIF